MLSLQHLLFLRKIVLIADSQRYIFLAAKVANVLIQLEKYIGLLGWVGSVNIEVSYRAITKYKSCGDNTDNNSHDDTYNVHSSLLSKMFFPKFQPGIFSHYKNIICSGNLGPEV
jgi:hypothetical protein